MNQKINILFILVHGSVWQYDRLYSKFKANERFSTKIIIAPYTLYGEEEMLRTLQETKKQFITDKYDTYTAYNENKREFVDIKTLFGPDIVFFTNPHELTDERYCIQNFIIDSLTCYVPYGILMADIEKMQFNLPFHNLLWKHFLITNIHRDMARQYADNKGSNVVVVGYPKCDAFFDEDYIPSGVWKKTRNKLKRVIWAPHHTIEYNDEVLGYSTFLEYFEFIKELTTTYKNSIQFALKPHPLLWHKLKSQKGWSDIQILEYRLFWDSQENTQLEEGEYIDLFIESDGMLLDSISFISEYMLLNKPALFLAKDFQVDKKFNSFGKQAMKHIYKAYSKQDIHAFLNNVIINKSDSLSTGRKSFVYENYIREKKTDASDIIYREITKFVR